MRYVPIVAAAVGVLATGAFARNSDFLGRSLAERGSRYSYNEISYSTVSSRLDACIAICTDRAKTNAVFAYRNPETRFRGEEFRQLLYEMGLVGALGREGATYRAMVETMQQLGPFVGSEAVAKAARIAEGRGDSIANFHLYLGEVRFEFVDEDGAVKWTNGADVGGGISRRFASERIAVPEKITQEEHAKRMLEGKAAGEEKAPAPQLEEKKPQAEEKPQVPILPPAPTGIGAIAALQYGAQMPGVSIMEAIPEAAFENGRIARGFGYLWDAYDANYEDAGTGKTVQEDRLLSDLGHNVMSKRAEYFLSEVALRIMRGEGLAESLGQTGWHLTERAKETDAWKSLTPQQQKKLARILENGKTYLFTASVDGKRIIDILHGIEEQAGFVASR